MSDPVPADPGPFRAATRPTMGTVASLTAVTAADTLEAALADAGRRWDELEAALSGWRPDSELSRLNRGEITLAQTGPDVREHYAAAKRWENATGGLFTPEAAPAGTGGPGPLDLHGITKALAIEEGRRRILTAGVAAFVLNVGGDVVVAGGPWRAGVVDPMDRTRLLAAVSLAGGGPGTAEATPWRALATSGTAERGTHLRGPRAGELAQVSVVAGDIVTADVLATAIAAGGEAAVSLAEDHAAAALAVTADGRLLASRHWPRSA